jgi:SAM-dependent methyltransferase
MQLNSNVRVMKYWTDRAAKYGEATVGHINRSAGWQQLELKEKKRFIFKRCPRNLPALDYGCGTGNYAGEFGIYLGVDIAEQLVTLAKAKWPRKNFLLLEEPHLDGLDFDYELFFTANVLQHNSDALVKRVLKSVAKDKEGGFQFVLYEVSDQQLKLASHMKARTHEETEKLVGMFFNIRTSRSWSHFVMGAEITLSIIGV